MKKVEMMNAVYAIIQKICKVQKASCVIISLVPIASDKCLITIKDIRNADMKSRIKNAISYDLCETLTFLKEYDHYLFYELAV